MMLDNLREVKERLRAFLPKSRADMHAALEANFDVDFLEQQLTHKVRWALVDDTHRTARLSLQG